MLCLTVEFQLHFVKGMCRIGKSRLILLIFILPYGSKGASFLAIVTRKEYKKLNY